MTLSWYFKQNVKKPTFFQNINNFQEFFLYLKYNDVSCKKTRITCCSCCCSAWIWPVSSCASSCTWSLLCSATCRFLLSCEMISFRFSTAACNCCVKNCYVNNSTKKFTSCISIKILWQQNWPNIFFKTMIFLSPFKHLPFLLLCD